ncbi:MAG: hypothetical protein KGL75_02970, partial [Acidobacteriota bacterium]|nr:hypothetical protein [Acidobacteriota bacterium]
MKARLPILLMLLPLFVPSSRANAPQTYATGYIKGSSDWWSFLNENFRSPVRSPQRRSFATSNLVIGSLSFGEEDLFELSGDPLHGIEVALGKAPVTERGDPSTSRSQICYTSAEHPGAMYLVFETGGSELNFYLFADGAPWTARIRCAPSALVSRSLATGSGLHLGMSSSEVEAVLGKPTAYSHDKLIYWGTTVRKTPVDVLNKLRQQHPKMSSSDFQNDFSRYDLTIYIEARFSAG